VVSAAVILTRSAVLLVAASVEWAHAAVVDLAVSAVAQLMPLRLLSPKSRNLLSVVCD